MKMEAAEPFNAPVDPIALGIPVRCLCWCTEHLQTFSCIIEFWVVLPGLFSYCEKTHGSGNHM